MNEKDIARKNYAALMLQSSCDLDSFAKVIGLSDKSLRSTKNDLAKKMRPSNSPSSRGITKSDLLNVQLIALLSDVGFDLKSAQFDDDMILTKIIGPGNKAYGFNTINKPLSDEESLVQLFKKDGEAKKQIQNLCQLKVLIAK